MREYVGDFEKYILQAILNRGNSAYGVQVLFELERKLDRNFSFSAVYTTLARLEKKKLVSSKKSEIVKVPGGKAKLFYSVTKAGKNSLNNSTMNLRKMGIV